MTARSDWRRINRAVYLAERTSQDAYVGTGKDGGTRLAKRLIRRRATRSGFQLLRGLFR